MALPVVEAPRTLITLCELLDLPAVEAIRSGSCLVAMPAVEDA